MIDKKAEELKPISSLNTIPEIVSTLNGLSAVVVEKTKDANKFNSLAGGADHTIDRVFFEKYAHSCEGQALEAEVLIKRISTLQ